MVDDSGPGIPAAVEAQIFDPFFTTKPLGVGTGIGLSISRGLAESQGGRLALVASLLGGAAFELTLPLASPDGSEPEADQHRATGGFLIRLPARCGRSSSTTRSRSQN